MMLENNKWYKSINGSVIFKTGSSSGFGLSSIYGWARMSTINFKLIRLWKEITSPKEVLVAINKGMKFIGYNDNTLIDPFKLSQSEKPIKLKDYHFEFKKDIQALPCLSGRQKSFSSTEIYLMNYGELWLTKRNNPKIEDRYVCVLKGGKFSKIVKRCA